MDVHLAPRSAARLGATDADRPPAPEPALLKALPLVGASLQARYPGASPALIQHCVDDALEELRGARIRHYLPILIERRAGVVLRHMLAQGSDAAASLCERSVVI